MLARAAVFVLWLLHFLPLRWLALLGEAVGLLAYVLVPSRRRVARVNLSLCFPELDDRERARLLRRHFRSFGRALIESGIGWWSRPARLCEIVRVEGREHLDALDGQRFIALVPHFVGIELEGLRLALEYGGVAVYVRQKDAYIDAFLKRKRERFGRTRMVSRQEGVKVLLRALRDGETLQLSPDMDLGARDAAWVSFFGVQAATVTALSRLARLTGSRVLPIVVRQLPRDEGYSVRIHPPWEDYPGASAEDDTRRMNAFIEERVREMPEQYLWTHRRFKTRPPGERPFYR